MGAGQVCARLHFGQAARSALEFKSEFAPGVELINWFISRDQQLDISIVKFIDHGDESSCRVGVIFQQLWHIRQHDRIEGTRNFNVVRAATWFFTQLGKLEPDDPLTLVPWQNLNFLLLAQD